VEDERLADPSEEAPRRRRLPSTRGGAPVLTITPVLVRVCRVSRGYEWIRSAIRDPTRGEEQAMGQETSKQKGSEGGKDKDEGWLKEAVGSLSRDDKERTEEQIDGATDRIEKAASSVKEGQAKEASSALSSGRHRDKVVGTIDKTKGWVKETSSSLTGNKEKRAEGRADQLKGVAKAKKGHVKDLFKFP
jgi:uncharacterized protein YjbJ (UPF0337 family)